MRLLIADKLEHEPLAELEILGVDVVHDPALSADDLPGAIEDVDILVVRSTQVTAEAIEAARSLSLIIRAGAGVDNIDVQAASRRGVYVANCPGRNGAAVAELAFTLLLALDRRLVEATTTLREGRWDKASFHSRGIYGRRLGIAGLGAIGKLVAKLGQAFGMDVYAWSRSLSHARSERLGVKRCGSLRELASSVDVLSLHLPLTPATDAVVNREILEALPDGATLLNTARAELIDEAALVAVAPGKRLRVGIDVCRDEPGDPTDTFRSPILSLGGGALVYATPHIGASTEQAQRSVAAHVCRIVRAFLTEEELPNVVNVCRNTPARYALVLRMRDEVGALANVLNVLKLHGFNIEEITNTVFEGASAACTKMRLSGRPSEACLSDIRAFEEVLHVDVVALPNLA